MRHQSLARQLVRISITDAVLGCANSRLSHYGVTLPFGFVAECRGMCFIGLYSRPAGLVTGTLAFVLSRARS